MMSHARARVLVADDDRDLLDAVAAALGRLGLDVVCAGSGGELVEHMAEEGPFDLIVTDVAMPWMSGLQAMRAVRRAGISTPVIVMTALKDEATAAQVVALDETAVLLRKPFELAELEAAASRLLSSQRSKAE